MKFGNVALYCKGWYQKRPGISNMWMDLIHCINADGFYVSTKDGVVEWCLHMLDELRDDPNFKNKYELELSHIWNEINRFIKVTKIYDNKTITFDDAIICNFRNIISSIEGKYFNEKLVKPNENVLPLSYRPAYYSDGEYAPDHKPTFIFAEMHSDVIKKIDEMFDGYSDQNIEYDSFEKVESSISGKSWKNVAVLIGTDSLLDCEEAVVSGNVLKYANNIAYKDGYYIDLGIYNNCIDFDSKKEYVCRIKKYTNAWGTIEYKLMSILKEV